MSKNSSRRSSKSSKSSKSSSSSKSKKSTSVKVENLEEDKSQEQQPCYKELYPKSEIEQAIVQSQDPIDLEENEEIEANDVRGVWLNKTENLNWQGPIPLEKYEINQDPEPEILNKKPAQKLLYKQQVQVRYLNPPEIPKPGDIIIKQLPNKQIPPAPPLIIRQNKPIPETPPPLVLREAPPKPPAKIPSKIINISGKVIPPPARKLVVEKLPQIPAKPQSILIERWLPYKQQKRKIIYHKPTEQVQPLPDPKNVIIDWQSPDVEVVQRFKSMGVFCTDPKEYVRRYGSVAKPIDKLPKIAAEIKAPEGLVLASESRIEALPKIEGDLEALKLVDLDKVGLGEFRSFLTKSGYLTQSIAKSSKSTESHRSLADDLFETIECDNGLARIDDAQEALYGLNSRYGKKLTQNELTTYLITLDADHDEYLTIDEFRKAFVTCTC